MTTKSAVSAIVVLLLTACASSDLGGVTDDFTVGTHVENWRDEIVYQVLTDRFANGDPRNDQRVEPGSLARYQGGDWKGLLDKLDYLDALGITAIWISPLVRNVDHDAGADGYHGYWTQDFTRLNPHFGDLATLRALVQGCHARGIKVVLDIVANHMGQVFFYDINLNGHPDELVWGSGTRSPIQRTTEWDPDFDPRGIQSFTSLGEAGPAPVVFVYQPELFRIPPMPEIFQRPEAYNLRGRVTDWNIEAQVVKGDFPGGLKDLNTLNPDVQRALVDEYVRWALAADLDGFRIDTLKHVEHEFWRYFTKEVRTRLAAAGKTNFIQFGEAFDGRDDLLGSFTQPGELDSVVYFSQKFQVFDDVFVHGGSTDRIARLFDQRQVNFSATPQEGGIGEAPRDVLVNFLDNHDVARFLYFQPDPKALRAALGYLLTEDGIPVIYYGTEQEFRGGNDPANREPLWWSGYDTTGETFQWTAKLNRLRRDYKALRRGTFSLTWTTPRTGSASDAGMVAFERKTNTGDYALVVINAQGAHPSVTAADGGDTMSVTAAPGSVLVDVLGNHRHTVTDAGKLAVTLDPWGVAVLVPEAQVIVP